MNRTFVIGLLLFLSPISHADQMPSHNASSANQELTNEMIDQEKQLVQTNMQKHIDFVTAECASRQAFDAQLKADQIAHIQKKDAERTAFLDSLKSMPGAQRKGARQQYEQTAKTEEQQFRAEQSSKRKIFQQDLEAKSKAFWGEIKESHQAFQNEMKADRQAFHEKQHQAVGAPKPHAT